MTFLRLRRNALKAIAAVPLFQLKAAQAAPGPFDERFAALEKDLDGRLGVAAIDTGSGKRLAWRAGERFAMCSTFKMMAAAAVLARSAKEPQLLATHVGYSKADLRSHSPVTEKHLAEGMTLEALCAAAVVQSDNCAANLLLKTLGGPAGLTRFARSIGDKAFRLDRWETELNTAIHGDPRDTTTPGAMMGSLQQLVLGETLAPPQRQLLKDWLIACTTGPTAIRAGVPPGWTVGDKTGAGGFGSRNDIAVLWPPGRAPIVLAVYTVQRRKDSEARNDIVAAAATLVAGAWSAA
jgi:beta-lactamase class A